MGFWPIVLNILKNSDVILLVVDARMPELTRNKGIIEKSEKMGRKRLFIVYNKIDLISKKEIESLKKISQNSFFVSSTKKQGITELKKSLENMAENWYRPSLRVGVVGYPNIGKSSLINLLAPKARAKVSPISGTTKETQWIRDGRLRIMDSPGVIPLDDSKSQVGIVAAKDPHKLKNPEKVAIRIIEFVRKKGNSLEKFYETKAETDYELFLAIGKKKGYLLKGGEIDENRTAVKIIDDWQKGRINLK
jgi:ribosome biogenesis GTPase A